MLFKYWTVGAGFITSINDDWISSTELSNRDSEIQKLNTEVTRFKDLEKQLKKQLSEQQQQNNHADENKIEIRNLQNALDSSKKELEAQRVLVNDYKVKLEDLNQQLTESKQLTNSKSSGDSFLVSCIYLPHNRRKLIFDISF